MSIAREKGVPDRMEIAKHPSYAFAYNDRDHVGNVMGAGCRGGQNSMPQLSAPNIIWLIMQQNTETYRHVPVVE